MDSPFGRRILKGTLGRAGGTFAGGSLEPEDRALPGTLLSNAIRELEEKSHGHVGDTEVEGIEGIEVTRV